MNLDKVCIETVFGEFGACLGDLVEIVVGANAHAVLRVEPKTGAMLHVPIGE